MAGLPSEKYERLPGRGGGFSLQGLAGTRCSLRLGSDHLLAVESSFGFVERYRRLRYADIQAIVATSASRTPAAAGLAAAAGIAASLCALGGTESLLWGALIYAPILLALAVHLARGPMVVCRLFTAVQVVRLPSLSRDRALRKALARLLPRIEAAQGGRLTAEALMSAPALVDRRPVVPRASAFDDLRVAVARARYRGHWHALYFALFLVDALLSVVLTFVEHQAFHVASVLLLLATLGVLVAAAARHGDPFVTRPLRAMTWVALGATVLGIYAGMGYGIFRAIASPGSVPALGVVFPATSDPGMRVLLVAWTLVAASLGLAGLGTWVSALLGAREREARQALQAREEAGADPGSPAPPASPAGEPPA